MEDELDDFRTTDEKMLAALNDLPNMAAIALHFDTLENFVIKGFLSIESKLNAILGLLILFFIAGIIALIHFW